MAKQRVKYRSAIGLEYREGANEVPRIGVKGELLLADEIVKIAKRYRVPVVEDSALVRSLNALKVAEYIPPRLFEAVALVLAQIDRQLDKLRNRRSSS